MRHSALIALMLIPTIATAQEHRELGSHEHGVGEVDIVIADSQLLISLDAPGMDIVGFEHAAATAEDRLMIATALAVLSEPGTVVLPSDAAGCELTSVEVGLHGEGSHEEEYDQDQEHDHDQDGERHDDEVSGGHSAFEAEYLFDCAAVQHLTALAFSYFDHFSNAEQLRVQAVGPSGASGFTVTPAAPTIELSELN